MSQQMMLDTAAGTTPKELTESKADRRTAPFERPPPTTRIVRERVWARQAA